MSVSNLPVPRKRKFTSAKLDPIFGARSPDELAFLPAALEVVETPASPASRLTALILTSLVVAAIGWACIGKVDVVSSASGKLIPSGGGKVVQPLETGTVTAIDARDGQTVHKGEVLVELEPTETLADRDRLKGELLGAKLASARLSDVALGKRFVGPTGADPAAVAVAREQARAQRAELAEKLATLDRQIEQHKAEAQEAQAEIARLAALLPIDEKSMGVFQELAKKGYGSALQLLSAEEKVEDTRRQLAVQRAKVPEIEAQIATVQRQRAETAAETAQTNLGDLADAKVKAASLEQQLDAAEEHLRTRTLTAPVDGVVQELAIHTVGGVVEPGQTIMRIAPAGAGVEVEAKLENKDVGFVRAGMEVAVKVETFPFTRYGVIRGTVTSVSNDAVSDKRPDGSEELTYVMKVKLSRDTMDVDGHTVRLTPGMLITAEVKTSQRRVIQYILSPLSKAIHEAGRER